MMTESKSAIDLALLVLEDGSVFNPYRFGAIGDAVGVH